MQITGEFSMLGRFFPELSSPTLGTRFQIFQNQVMILPGKLVNIRKKHMVCAVSPHTYANPIYIVVPCVQKERNATLQSGSL